jgi:lipoprotein-anchoring transpeptidase ErfK/SrfK
MSSTGRHASAPALRFPTRLGVTTAVAALVAVTAIVGAVAARSGGSPNPGPASPAVPGSTVEIARANAVPALTGLGHAPSAVVSPPGPASTAPASTASASTAPASTASPSVAAPARRATMPLVLTAVDHQACLAAAAACVDLARHVTWLQANGKITFGPVKMEPGKPGSRHQTPRGTFHVEWKAGPSYVSNIYDEPMPWATFFASGGIAFHGGSLTAWSHGCVHLTVRNAHYYNQHLPVGAEVVVF